MGVHLSSTPQEHKKSAGPYLPLQIHCFPLAKPHMLALLRGVDLNPKPQKHKITGPHLPSQNHCSPNAKLHIFGVPDGGGSISQTSEAQSCQASSAIAKPLLFLCKTVLSGTPDGVDLGNRSPKHRIAGPEPEAQNCRAGR